MFRRNINIFNIKTKKKSIYIKTGCTSSLSGSIKANKIILNNESFIQSLMKHIGQTITIYTISGGVSGYGFTGVLLDICKEHIKILTGITSPPSCSRGNTCVTEYRDIIISTQEETSLGSITEIPIDKIAAFVHNVVG